MTTKEEMSTFIQNNKHYIGNCRVFSFKGGKDKRIFKIKDIDIQYDHDLGIDRICITYIDLYDMSLLYRYFDHKTETLEDHFKPQSELIDILYL